MDNYKKQMEAWKKQPYKIDGEGKVITNGDELATLPRKVRKYVETRIRKGRSIEWDDLEGML